jgi:Ni/Co efflux regulator RcnB
MLRIALPALLLFALVAAPAAAFDPPPGKSAAKAARGEAKARQQAVKQERTGDKAWLKAERERQKSLRKQQRISARAGWYDGSSWNAYGEEIRYRDGQWQAVVSYAAPRPYLPPPQFEAIVYEPGMRLPEPWYRSEYRIEHRVYNLPPPPPQHHWVMVDDDAVLVALASGLIADFVYDLFR